MIIPSGQKLRLYAGEAQQSVTGNIDLLLDEDVTLNISSDFDNLIANGGGNTLASVLARNIEGIGNLGLSGQFKQQGFQVWKSTQPMEMSFNCHLIMKISGKTDVYDPAIEVMKLAVPSEGRVGLVPPGPSVKYALQALAEQIEGEDATTSLSSTIGGFFSSNVSAGLKGVAGTIEEGGKLTLVVGKYINLSPVIITKATPIWSKETDTAGYPIWCRLQLDVRTADIVTQEMLDNMDDFSQLEDDVPVDETFGEFFG